MFQQASSDICGMSLKFWLIKIKGYVNFFFIWNGFTEV